MIRYIIKQEYYTEIQEFIMSLIFDKKKTRGLAVSKLRVQLLLLINIVFSIRVFKINISCVF